MVLAAIGQDTWSTAGHASDYELTLRANADMGLSNPPLGAMVKQLHLTLAPRSGGSVQVLFEDRVPDDCLSKVSSGAL